MPISVRLDKELELELAKLANAEGKSKSEFLRTMIAERIREQSARPTPWHLGKDFFGKYGSGRKDLSVNRKKILNQKLKSEKGLSS